MYKLFVIAKNNMKKQKGDMITFLILTFISAFLIFDCMSAILGLGKVMDDKFEEINGAHIMLYNYDTEVENKAAEETFKENEHIIDYEKTPVMIMTAEYKNKNEEEFGEFTFIAENFDEEKKIMAVKRPDVALDENDILLPLNMKGKYAVGDTIELKLEDDIYDLNVAGYLEDPYFCSTTNVTIFYVNMSQKMIDKMIDEHPVNASKAFAHKGIVDKKELEDGLKTADLEKEMGDAYKEKLAKYGADDTEHNFTNYIFVNWQMMRGGSQFIPIVVIAVVLMFAILIMIIAIVIISFSIKNFIQKNMKNTGILEASGYTVKELRRALTLQIVLVSFIGSVAGIIVGMLTFSGFGDIISSVLGLSWNQPANIICAVGTLLGILLLILLVSIGKSKAYKKISVLDALRGGINTHNFKKNHFSFEKTPLPVSIVLALKDTFGGVGRNLAMVIISMLLTISTLVGFGMLENFGQKPDTLIKIMGFELASVGVIDNDANADYQTLTNDLKGVDGVENVLVVMGFEPVVNFNGKSQNAYTYVYDDADNAANTVLLEGRQPKADNEVLVTSGIVKDLGIKTGDVIELEYAGNKEEFIVVGINQRMERMGRTVIMNIDAAKKLIPGKLVYSYYVYAKDGVSYDALSANIEKMENEKGYDLFMSNMDKQMEGTMDALVIAMKILCIIIVVITVFVVIFVESLVIRAKISREWRKMGISKALGQTSGGLVSQIMLSNIPAILVGCLIGVLLSPAAGGGICKLAFSLFAMETIKFPISAVWMVVTVVGIIAVAIGTSALAGLRVRKLEPVLMITEE